MATQPEKPPHTQVTDWSALCHKHDPNMEKPEVVYKFSGGIEKKSTDRTESGVYRRP